MMRMLPIAAVMLLPGTIDGLALAQQESYWTLPTDVQGSAPAGHHPLTHDLSPAGCALCHADKHRQWRDSFHARSITPGLVGQLTAFDEPMQRHCLTCHAPRGEHHALWESRGSMTLLSLHGVDCTSCHVREHQRHGPRDIAQTPHGPVRGLTLFKQSQFCAACHQFDEEGLSLNGKPLENTYEEWRASRYAHAGQTCQDCHMPQGRHEFRGIHDPEMTRRGLAISAVRDAQGVLVKAWNAGAGHALPTYATPRITITIEAESGESTRRAKHVIQRRLSWSPEEGWRELSDTRLFPDESMSLGLRLEPSQVARVEIRVKPDADYHDRVYPMLLSLLGEHLSDQERRLLEEARLESGRSDYALYSAVCPAWNGAEVQCAVTP